MGKLLVLAVIGILTALVVERIVRLRQAFNISREYEQLEPPNCRFIEGIETGAEDIDILPNGLAFMSAGLKYPGVTSFAPDEHGNMLLLDLNEEEPKPVVLKISSGFDIDSFNPHGISVYVDDEDDSVYIFVVNHPKMSTTVEVFKFQEEEKSLLHLKTIEHELLQSVNDIAAVGPESFYATNDHYFVNTLGRLAEVYLNIPLENIVYYSPNEVKEVASGLNFANGITMSHDKKYVYACSLFDNSISVFEKHANWSLSPVKELHIDKLVDNLCLDPTTGDVWIGCHIDAWTFFNYDPKSPPGSEFIISPPSTMAEGWLPCWWCPSSGVQPRVMVRWCVRHINRVRCTAQQLRHRRADILNREQDLLDLLALRFRGFPHKTLVMPAPVPLQEETARG